MFQAGIWCLQGVFDLFLVIGFVVWYRQRRRPIELSVEQKIEACAAALEKRARQLEQQMEETRSKIENQLRDLIRICDKAHHILNRGYAQVSSYSPSVEQAELESAFKDPTVDNSIPTLERIEKTRERLHSEITIDLQTLLRTQLA